MAQMAWSEELGIISAPRYYTYVKQYDCLENKVLRLHLYHKQTFKIYLASARSYTMNNSVYRI